MGGCRLTVRNKTSNITRTIPLRREGISNSCSVKCTKSRNTKTTQENLL